MDNPWEGVRKIRPREAEVELGFLLLDLAADDEPDTLEYSRKVGALINGIYLAGWSDAKTEIARVLNDQ